MKPSAKQLTFLYFSIVALAIIAIHASVFISTAENMELLYAENRLGKISEYVLDAVEKKAIEPLGSQTIQTQGQAEFDPFIAAYFEPDSLPSEFGKMADIPTGVPYEVVNSETGKTYFVTKEKLGSGNEHVVLALDNSFYELTEEQLLDAHFRQIVISVLLVLVSLFVVLKISERLTKPVTRLISNLSSRPPESLEPISVPKGTLTKEVHQLVESFNDFQKRIKTLVERERSFNRYASHELRTPLMVMKGAITLLGESHEEKFVEKQRVRLERATEEMNEFVQTLLSLTKIPSEVDVVPRQVSDQEVQDIVNTHLHLLSAKPVRCEVKSLHTPEIRMPDPAFRILLGNLLKNAFAHTQKGSVTVELDSDHISVIDSGTGFNKKEYEYEGYGLGLLLVKDICRQFGYSFTLVENVTKGCTATITLDANSAGVPL